MGTRTVQEIVDHVKRQFGDEASVQITDADIIRWINAGQIEILNKNPVLKTQAVTDVVADQVIYTLPDILFIQTVMYNNRPIEQKSFQEAQEYILKDALPQGPPTLWWEYGGNINLYPTPTEALVNGLTIYYVKLPAVVTAGADAIELPDRYYNTLVNYVMAQAYEQDDDWTASGNKVSQFEAGMNVLAEEQSPNNRNTYPTITVLPEDM